MYNNTDMRTPGGFNKTREENLYKVRIKIIACIIRIEINALEIFTSRYRFCIKRYLFWHRRWCEVLVSPKHLSVSSETPK